MKRVLPILLIAFLLAGCYTEFLTTESEDTTDSTWSCPPAPPPPPPPAEPVIILVPAPTGSPAPAPTETRRDFGSTRGSTEQTSTGRSSSGGKTEGRGR
jgi:hypothetical protein